MNIALAAILAFLAAFFTLGAAWLLIFAANRTERQEKAGALSLAALACIVVVALALAAWRLA